MPPFHAFRDAWSDDDSDVDIEDFKKVPKPQKWKHQRNISTDVEVVDDGLDSRSSTPHHNPQHRLRRGHERERSLPSNTAITLSDDASRESSPEGHAIKKEKDRKWQQEVRGDTNKDEWLELSESDHEVAQQISENETIEVHHGDTTLVQESEALTRASSVVVEQLQDAGSSAPDPADQSLQLSSPPTPTSQSSQRYTKSQHAIPQSATTPDRRDTIGSSRPARKHQAKERKSESSDMVEPSGSVSHVYSTERSGVNVYEMNINGILVMRNQDDSWVNASSMLRAIGVKDGQMRRKIVIKAGGPQRVTNGGHWFYQGRWVPLATARDLATMYDVKAVLPPLLDLPESQSPSSREVSQPKNERPVFVSLKSMTSEYDDGMLKSSAYKNAQEDGKLATREDWGNSSDSEDDVPEIRHVDTRPSITSDLPTTINSFRKGLDGSKKRPADTQHLDSTQSLPPRKRARINSLSALPTEIPGRIPESHIVRYSQRRRDNEKKAANELQALLPPQYLCGESDIDGQCNPTTRIIQSAIAFIVDLSHEAISGGGYALNGQQTAIKEDKADDLEPKVHDYNKASSESLNRRMIQKLQRPETNIVTDLDQYGHKTASVLRSQHVGKPRKSTDQYAMSKTAIKNREQWYNLGDLERWFRRRELADNSAVHAAMEKIKSQPVWDRLTEGEKERIRHDERQAVLQQRFDQGKSQSYSMAQLIDVGKQCGVSDGDMLSLVLSKQSKAREAIIELFNGVVKVAESGELALADTPTTKAG